ncbi:uncharacterized protein isoform X2 [Musca autumnalis]
MANMIGNNNNPNSLNSQGMPLAASSNPNANSVVGGHSVGGISSLREISDYLLPNGGMINLAPGQCPYDHIIEMIRGLDLDDDGITMNHKIKSIEADFCNIVQDENMLCESMAYINDKALEDGETALKFALLFASRNFDALAMKETKVRTAMLTLLQKNFVNSENYRLYDRERLYNSIILLGEYYHRVRLADNAPITILGESLLSLLIREISEEKNVNNVKLVKLILSQITLNGGLLRNLHNGDLSQLLYLIRKNLIEQPNLKPNVKAIMLMTLDLFYSNFESLGSQLEGMYSKYLIMEDDDESEDMGNNNQNLSSSSAQQTHHQQQQQSAYTNTCPTNTQRQGYRNETCNNYDEVPLPSSSNNTSYENGDSGNVNDNTEEDQDNYKRWNDQECGDSLEECDLNVGGGVGMASRGGGAYKNDDRDQVHSSNSRHENDPDRDSRNSRRAYQPRQSPRPLNQNYSRQHENQHQSARDSQNSGNEERDESKPLPRWRAPRFNRDDQHKDNRSRNVQRRFSGSFDDDRQSVRSDGGSIRLYSINDRLKHAQEKIERSGNPSTYTGIANSNWDRQSQRDDRSERSYMSNYERGNNHRRGGRHYNQRPMYDKPPRFQKNKGAANNNHNGGGGGADKNQPDTWRRSNSNLKYYDENSQYNNTNGPESNSRSSSRARTLPRPAKSRMDGSGPGGNSYRRSQSPNSYQRGGASGGGVGGNHHNSHNHQNKNRTRHFGQRYSSQSSLASEGSSTFDRHSQHHRNRSFSRRNPSSAMQQSEQPPPQQQQTQHIPPPPRKEKENEDDWTDNEATNSEL